jgi:hypothetical protein
MTRTEYVMRLIGPLAPVTPCAGAFGGAAPAIWPSNLHPAGSVGHPRLQAGEDQRLQPCRTDCADIGSTLFAGGGPAEPGGAGGARSMMRQP